MLGCHRRTLRTFLLNLWIRKWFESRSNIPWLKMIIWVTEALRRTLDGDWLFDNLCGCHLQSHYAGLDSEGGFCTGCGNSVPNNNPSQGSSHLDHHSQSRLCENAAISLYSLHMQKQFVNWKCCGTMIDNFILVHFISALQMPVLSCVPFLLQDYSINETKPTIRCPCRCKVRALQRRPQ